VLSLRKVGNGEPARTGTPTGKVLGAVAATSNDEGMFLLVSRGVTMLIRFFRCLGGADLASSLAAALAQRKGDMGDSDDEEESDDEWD
jgi:hypothetical protein